MKQPPKPKSARARARSQSQTSVRVQTEDLVLPTYLPAAPDLNPMFLEKRVYQGSSGKVYPLPFTDRVAETPVDRAWKAIWIENEYLKALVLPEIGGRIHAIQDKTNGYDLIYNQPVIKPALVGLAGPWASGGIEFNWPQHHRADTFLPVDIDIEKHPDGSATIWCSAHDPLCRLKGMHGICLHPGCAYLELKVRAYNRTPFTHTFLWWANVATRVHEAYQSFFPPDVSYVADHAKRAISEYPLAKGAYYGVDYGKRGRHGMPLAEQPSQFIPPHGDAPTSDGRHRQSPAYAANDLSFYANIPTPCSYMCLGSQADFFGGYDHVKEAGLIHVANHHISPGKKQWTWGNHAFGYAWDRNLTDPDAKGELGPYIEIMAGVYTDNQPDFSFLQPGETKSWSQYWYPIQKTGPAQQANQEAAVSLALEPRHLRIGVNVTRVFRNAVIALKSNRASIEWEVNLAPGEPFAVETRQPPKPWKIGETTLSVMEESGRNIISYRPQPRIPNDPPQPATEPPPPEEIASADELYLTGLHLEQYRHATRSPVDYWQEALRRDPLDARCNNALGLWRFRRGEFPRAEIHFRKAIQRLTHRNPNPYDGEPYYNLGLCLRYQLDADLAATREPSDSPFASARFTEAYASFYKATWNQAWAAAGYQALAEMDCLRGDWRTARDHLHHALRFDTDHLRARNLKVLVLRRLRKSSEAEALLNETQQLDRLDWWARHLAGETVAANLQTALDVAHDYARSGFYREAIGLLKAIRASQRDLPDQSWGAEPLVQYTLGWLETLRGKHPTALKHFRKAASLSPNYCFPARLEEIAILTTAMAANPQDARAPYYLGNLLYDRRRHREAIRLWERSACVDSKFSVVWRNLGIAYLNIRQQPRKARAAYDRAFHIAPDDARLLFERDQLWKRLGEKPAKRLRELERHQPLVQQRDDLSIELCALYNQTDQPEKALALVDSRHFQPWEGGEGGPLGQWKRSHLALGKAILSQHRNLSASDRKRGKHGRPLPGTRPAVDLRPAAQHFAAALTAPPNLGEAWHLLVNQSDVHYWLGRAFAAVGDQATARKHWRRAATFRGDFQEMSVRAMSEMTYYSALSCRCLNREKQALKRLHELLDFGRHLQKTEAKIDYFATSLPTMLLFEDDLQCRQTTRALVLQAQALMGLGRKARSTKLLAEVLAQDPNHALAFDLQNEIHDTH